MRDVCERSPVFVEDIEHVKTGCGHVLRMDTVSFAEGVCLYCGRKLEGLPPLSSNVRLVKIKEMK